eukprot:scaffold5986_cov128-Isochrysis_galbana.AAC.8
MARQHPQKMSVIASKRLRSVSVRSGLDAGRLREKVRVSFAILSLRLPAARLSWQYRSRSLSVL